jgi:ribosomal protein S18 acetylase RimI-like enzyme
VIRRLANTDADIALGLELVREYVIATADETGHDVELIWPLIREIHDFSGHYLTSGGAFLVADEPDGVAGGVGVTPVDATNCEMNRLWVRAPFRRRGLARALSEASMDAARALGFTRMVLDVVPERTGAIALYESLGFTPTEPIHEYPFPMVPLGRPLSGSENDP